jgi:hypothetical protein
VRRDASDCGTGGHDPRARIRGVLFARCSLISFGSRTRTTTARMRYGRPTRRCRPDREDPNQLGSGPGPGILRDPRREDRTRARPLASVYGGARAAPPGSGRTRSVIVRALRRRFWTKVAPASSSAPSPQDLQHVRSIPVDVERRPPEVAGIAEVHHAADPELRARGSRLAGPRRPRHRRRLRLRTAPRHDVAVSAQRTHYGHGPGHRRRGSRHRLSGWSRYRATAKNHPEMLVPTGFHPRRIRSSAG